MPSPPPQRVSQLDAHRLDEELIHLFTSSTQTVLRHFPSSLAVSYLPVLKSLIRLFFYSNTLLVGTPTPGSALHNLHTTTPSKTVLPVSTRLLYIFFEILLPHLHFYLYRRTSPSNRRFRNILSSAEAVVKLAQAFNLLLFFRSGHFRSLTHRLLRIRMTPLSRSAPRAPSFEFVNSQLIWQGIAEFALLIAPLLSASALLRRWNVGRMLLAGLGVGGGGADVVMEGRGVQRCAECGAGDIVMPHRALPCRHLFCYVCVAGSLEKDPGFQCAVCGAGVHSVERVTFG